MDAFDIALLMANQHADSPVRMRYGTVVGACDESVLSVVPDGQESPVPAVRCCLPVEGSRVVLLVNGTEWLAVSVVGGDCPYGVDDVWITFSGDDPHIRWLGTTWEQLHDRMLLASGKRTTGETGGEEEHTLSVGEMPNHGHTVNGIGMWVGSSGNGNGFTATGQWNTVGNNGNYEVYGPGYWTSNNNGGNLPHNNMPPYISASMWKRIA